MSIKLEPELVYADRQTTVHHQGDKAIITHREYIEPVFARVQQARLHGDNGFSRGRTLRYLGSVPLSTLLANPELAEPNNLRKYLRRHSRLRAVPADSF